MKRITFSVVLFLLLGGMATAGLAAGVEGLLQQAAAAWKAKKYDEAEQAYRKAVAAEPESVKAHERLAAFYLSRQRAAEAVPEYQAAIMADPENPRLFLGLSIAYLHQHSYGMAKAMADRALELDPSLKNVAKLQQYIDAKQKVLARAHAAGKAAAGSH